MIEKYIPPQIPQQLVEDYEKALAEKQRWINAATPSAKPETDLEHVEATLEIIDEVEVSYRTLASVLDFNLIRGMDVVHEVGEIVMGDLARSNPEYDRIKPRHKRKEKVAARGLLRKYIEDPDIQQKAIALYDQYASRKPDDPNALFFNLIDKIQAVRFGLDHVFNNTDFPRESRLRHAAFSIGLIFQFANPLLDILRGEAKGDLVKFLQVEFGRYIQGGFPELAREARHKLFSENPNESTLPF